MPEFDILSLPSKDFALEIPITIVHPDALAELPLQLPSFASKPIIDPQYTSSPEQQNQMRPLPQPTIPLYVDSYIQQAWVDPASYQYHLAQEFDSPHIPQSLYETTLHSDPQQGFTHLDFPPRQLPLRPSSPSSLSFSPVLSQGGGCTSPISGMPNTSETHTVILPLPALHPYPQTSTQLSVYTPSIPSHYDNRAQNEGSPSRNPPRALSGLQEERREKEREGIACISPPLRHTSVSTGRGVTESPVARQYRYPLVNNGTTVDIRGAYPPADAGVPADVINFVKDPAAVAISHSITPTPNGGVDLLSLSPKPRNRFLTSLDMNTEVVVKSDGVLQPEKNIMSDECLSEAETGNRKGKERLSEEINMNKTFSMPLPVTKSCVIDKTNGVNVDDHFIESTMIPLSPLSSQDSSQAIAPPVPPTPTLVACKRPSRVPIVPTNLCGGMESGLNVLEGQITAQMGKTGKKCDDLPCDIGPPTSLDTRSLRGKPSTKTESSAPSSSTTPNLEGKIVQSRAGSASSERMLPDESAISSLTLDQSSVGDVDGDRYRESIREHRVKETRNDDDDEQEQEQESVDGGKTHKAGKSIVEVQSYLQSRRQHPQQCESTSVEPYSFSPIASPGDTKPPITALQITSTGPVQKKGLNKLKKSAQTRGRVTSWLGKIDPDAPPPQEEIIPPSPSAARAVEWDLLDITEKAVSDFDLHTRSCLRTHSFSRSPSSPSVPAQLPTSAPLCSSVHLETDEATTLLAAAATSPDPRSSGFISIEELEAQRDTITNPSWRSVLLRADDLLKKARVLDSRAEAPQSSLSVRPVLAQTLNPSTVIARSSHRKEVKGKEQEYLFNSPKLINVNQRNSLLSANTGVQVSSKPVAEPQSVAVPPPTLDDKRMTPRSTSSPASYANVVSRTRSSGAPVINHGPSKQNGRLSICPSTTSPREIQYDIFKQGGGRAIVTAGNATGSVKPGVVTSDDPGTNKRLATRDRLTSASSGAFSSKRSESPVIFGFPLPPNGPETNDLQSLPSSKLKPLRTTSKPKTPPLVNKFKSRPSLPTRPLNNIKTAPRSDSVQKSIFRLPQALSSPTSSSTVSPVHPSRRAGSQIAAVVGLPGIGRGDYKSAVLSNVEGGQSTGSVKHSSAVKKMFRRGAVDEEDVERTYLGIKRVPTKSKARRSMVPTTIVDVNAANPYATSSSMGEGRVKPSSNDMVLGQSRLRKKY